MAELTFSPAQRTVIDTRKKNMLVSAAAGSGKTTVLVRRIIERITDKDNPTDIDEMLVLTFTNAAAADMREKINDALRKELAKNPGDENLQRQSMLIYNAQITTIHSFCLYLLRNNFADVGIEPDFRTADKGEMLILQEQQLDETVEELLSGNDIGYFDEFLRRFDNKDKLNKIKAAITAMYEKAQDAPFIEDYLEVRKNDYRIPESGLIEDIDWIRDLLAEVKAKIREAYELALENLKICETDAEEYLENAKADKELLEGLLECSAYDDFREGLTAEFVRKSSKKGPNEEARQKFSNNRDLIKKEYIGPLKDYFVHSQETLKLILEENGKVISALSDATLYYHRRLEEKKREKKIITFSDMEHYALKILLYKEGDKYLPTSAALDYRSCFKEIMIDEYQDSSLIQELMLSTLSGESVADYNRFMVGDVKQSIYSFRNAKPELFMDKYGEYAEDGNNKIKIDLSYNYRSREEVLSAVNTIFAPTMTRDRGGVDYDDNAALHVGADYYKDTGSDNKSELLLMSTDPECGMDDREQEALMIAARIKELLANHKIQDKDSGEARPCTYRDIVILLRSSEGFDEKFKRILEEKGIPAYITSKKGYFDTEEVVTVLNFLSVIDNPNDEIAMFGTLKSVFGKFTEEEIAVLKILERGNLYKGLKMAQNCGVTELVNAQKDLNDEIVSAIKDKSEIFLAQLDRYRKELPYTPIGQLIREIYDSTRYVEMVSSGFLGEKKKANVLMLLHKAEEFESREFRGLFHFNRYIRLLHQYGSDDGDAVTLDESANLVRIMTMHKSKGLEFPVCIVAGLSKGFNNADRRGDMVFHSSVGVGLDYIDSKRRVRYSDLRLEYIKNLIKKDGLSEEMRVLYVALTRAKEKLIITASVKPDKEIKADYNSYLGIIMQSKGEDDWKGNITEKTYKLADIYETELEETLTGRNLKKELEEKLYGAGVAAPDIMERIRFNYDHAALRNLYNKTSVSELKIAAMHKGLLKDEEEEKTIFPTELKEKYIPDFVGQEEKEVSGAARGSAYHRAMELMDFAKDSSDYEAVMQENIRSGRLLEEDYKLVDKRKILKFLDSPLGQRMHAAAETDNLYKEQPFVLGIRADRLSDEFPSDETVMIQGIIDVFFIEDGEIVLMDYKTDAVKEEKELIDRYKTQLDYYEEALKRITGMNVKERLIYSFALGETISL
jgi:ATP-dependent helicase/nuclease subunit A